ncbi:hypothetical protein SRHO_G00220250 [Serrasalmus rhombeus]
MHAGLQGGHLQGDGERRAVCSAHTGGPGGPRWLDYCGFPLCVFSTEEKSTNKGGGSCCKGGPEKKWRLSFPSTVKQEIRAQQYKTSTSTKQIICCIISLIALAWKCVSFGAASLILMWQRGRQMLVTSVE